jgi:hypothetical protein
MTEMRHSSIVMKYWCQYQQEAGDALLSRIPRRRRRHFLHSKPMAWFDVVDEGQEKRREKVSGLCRRLWQSAHCEVTTVCQQWSTGWRRRRPFGYVLSLSIIGYDDAIDCACVGFSSLRIVCTARQQMSNRNGYYRKSLLCELKRPYYYYATEEVRYLKRILEIDAHLSISDITIFIEPKPYLLRIVNTREPRQMFDLIQFCVYVFTLHLKQQPYTV